MEERAKKIPELLKLLANEQSLLILCALLEGKLTVSDIHLHTPDITASALSQHLNQLRTAGILASEKHGMNVVYRSEDKRVTTLIVATKEESCRDRRAHACQPVNALWPPADFSVRGLTVPCS